MDMLDKEKIPLPGGTEQEGERFQHATQNDTQFTTYELLISEIFPLVFGGHKLTTGKWNHRKENLREGGANVFSFNIISMTQLGNIKSLYFLILALLSGNKMSLSVF